MEEKGKSLKERLNDSFFDNFIKKYMSYFDGKYTNKIKNLELGLKVSFLCLGLSILLNMFLVNNIISISKDKIIQIDIPQELQSGNYSISPTWASENYHMMFARSMILNSTSFDFKTIEDKVNSMLVYTPTEQYINSKAELIDEVEFVKKNKVSQIFTVKEWKFSSVKALDSNRIITSKITAVGFLTRKVGGTVTADNIQYEFPIEIQIINGLPWIKNLEPIYTDFRKRKNETTSQKENK